MQATIVQDGNIRPCPCARRLSKQGT